MPTHRPEEVPVVEFDGWNQHDTSSDYEVMAQLVNTMDMKYICRFESILPITLILMQQEENTQELLQLLISLYGVIICMPISHSITFHKMQNVS